MPTVYVTAPREVAADLAATLVEELHPYEVPCIERFDEADALESFAGWVADSLE